MSEIARLQQKTEEHFSRKTKMIKVNSHSHHEEKFHSEFSFMAFVLGIFGLLLPLFSVLAIIFGIGGLMQTHRERMKGRGMAVAGIILGFVGIILITMGILFNVSLLEDYLLRFGTIETLVGKLQ